MNAKTMLLTIAFAAAALTSAVAVDIAPAAHQLELSLHDVASKVNAAKELRALIAKQHASPFGGGRHHGAGSVRGRELVEANTCEWKAAEKICDLDPITLEAYKPATEKGIGMMDYLIMPGVKCAKFTSVITCPAECSWNRETSPDGTDDSSCVPNLNNIQTQCDEKDKKPVTFLSHVTSETARCEKYSTMTNCDATKDCIWDTQMKGCGPDLAPQIMGMMGMNQWGPMSSSMIEAEAMGEKCLAVNRMMGATPGPTLAPAPAYSPGPSPSPGGNTSGCNNMTVSGNATSGNTTNGTNTSSGCSNSSNMSSGNDISASCKKNPNCTWDGNFCGASAAASLAAVQNNPMLGPIMEKALICAFKSGNQTMCDADAMCAYDATKKECTLPQAVLVNMMLDTMPAGPFKNMTKSYVLCDMVDDMSKCTAVKGCAAPTMSGATKCEVNTAVFMADIMTAEVPGQPPRCASLMDTVMAAMIPVMIDCMPSADAATCNAAATCEWDATAGTDDTPCVPSSKVMLTAFGGAVDGDNLFAMMQTCKAETSAAACATVKQELDFYSIKNPSKKKVSTTMTLKGITNVDKSNQAKIKTAIAASLGDGVSADDIVFTKVHFPVKAQMKLVGKTMEDVTKDKPAFEASFKKGMAADLGVAAGDITIKEIKAAAARRRSRGLLAAGVSVDFSVDNAADTATATALAGKVSSAAASSTSNLAKETATTPAVAVAPTFALEVEMEVSTTDSASVASALSADTTSATMVTNLKAEGFTDVATIVVAKPTVVQNTAPASTASGSTSGSSRSRTGIVLAAIATALFMLF